MTMSYSEKVRELTGNERKFLWSPVANVNVTARVLGKIDENDFRNAIAKLEKRHPLIRTKVRYQNDRAWFVNGDVPEIPVRFVKRNDDKQWIDEVMGEYKTPFNPFTGPLIRFSVVLSEEVSEIIIYCQHSICDGTALVYVMRDLLEIAANPDMAIELLPLPAPLSPENLPEGSDMSGLKAKIRDAAMNSINKKWRQNKITFDQEDFENIFSAYWQKHEYRIIFLEMEAQETNRLVQACRENNVTVNSALCAAFLGAYKELNGSFKGNKRSVAVPVDLRRRMKPEAGDVLSLYVGSILCKYDYHLNESFWDNTKRFHQLILKDMEKTNLFEIFHNLERMDHTMLDCMVSFAPTAKYVTPEYSRFQKLNSFYHDKKNMAIKMSKKFAGALPGMVMTNLGRANIKDTYGRLKIDKLFFLPSTGEDFPLALGAVTINDKMVVTVNYVEKSKESMLLQVCDKAKRQLQ